MLKAFTTLVVGMALVSASPLPTSNTMANAREVAIPDAMSVMTRDPSSFKSYQTGGLVRQNLTSSTVTTRSLASSSRLVPRDCPKLPVAFNPGDTDTGGPGLLLMNGDGSNSASLFVYQNSCDDVPWTYTTLAPFQSVYLSLPAQFAGRVTRGTPGLNLAGNAQTLGTWLEISWDANNVIWGDVSVIPGCDGAVLMAATDGSYAWKGFMADILQRAPADALVAKSDGTMVLAPTERGGAAGQAAEAYEIQTVGSEYIYVDDSHGNPVIASQNGRFIAWFWPGAVRNGRDVGARGSDRLSIQPEYR